MAKLHKKLKRVKIHREGTDILVVTFVLLLILNVLIWSLSTPWGIATSIITGIFYLLLVNFFRSPKRHFTGNEENVVVSSVDGTVVALI